MNAAPRPGWLNRHWKWALPVFGAFVLALLAGTLALAVSGIFGMMKSSYVYQIALRRAQRSSETVAALGAPIEPGWWLTGEMKTSADSGHAALRFPLAGPKGEGDVSLVADRRDGAWVFSALTVETDAGAHIDLLTEDEKRASTPSADAR